MTKRTKKPIPRELRLQVFERDSYTCRYCGLPATKPHCDHVYPESRGGATELGNLATACRKCNIKKHAAIGVWPLPVDFQNQVGVLVGQAEAAERRYRESEWNRREIETFHSRVVATASAMIEQTNLYSPLLISLSAAVLSLLVLLIGIEAGNLVLLLIGVSLICVFVILSLVFRLAVRWIDREHTKTVQAINAHRRHCNRGSPTPTG